jgi:hypothetical protein
VWGPVGGSAPPFPPPPPRPRPQTPPPSLLHSPPCFTLEGFFVHACGTAPRRINLTALEGFANNTRFEAPSFTILANASGSLALTLSNFSVVIVPSNANVTVTLSGANTSVGVCGTGGGGGGELALITPLPVFCCFCSFVPRTVCFVHPLGLSGPCASS